MNEEDILTVVGVSRQIGPSDIVVSGCDVHPKTSKLTVPIIIHTMVFRVISSPPFTSKAKAPELYR
jgi:hypothetical protein